MKRIIDLLAGDSRRRTARWVILYGNKDYGRRAEAARNKMLQKYAVMMGITLLLAVLMVFTEDGLPEGVKEKDGRLIAVQRPPAGEGTLRVNAKIAAGTADAAVEEEMVLMIRPEGEAEKKMSEESDRPRKKEDRLAEEMRTLVKKINAGDEGKEVILPLTMENGTKLHWESVQKGNLPFLLIAAVLVFVMIYRGRYEEISKEEKKARESMVKELPGFISKLALLLDAGLVLTTSFSRVLDGRRQETEENSYFYRQLLMVEQNGRETMTPMQDGFRDFARRSGVKELVRLSNIISDNVHMGAGLVDKLRNESEMLWLMKKKQAEEKGRLAESKMTFPLVILLLVLIAVTVAPALMEM